jgi:hypothetical protein
MEAQELANSFDSAHLAVVATFKDTARYSYLKEVRYLKFCGEGSISTESRSLL